jgi:UDP-N-acetylmuramyl pentapeptide synthase
MKDNFRRLVSFLLEFQTRRLFKTHRFLVVAVSGAVGKTTTKLAIATVLAKKYQVLVQQGSFNDEIGLPLACFNLELPTNIFNPLVWVQRLVQMEAALHRPYPYEVLVIEIGTDAPGEVPHTLSYLQHDIGVVTAVTPEHMEFFGSLDAVAKEELAMVAGSKQSVVNHDDVDAKYRRKYVDAHPHVYYGLGNEVEYGVNLESTDLVKGTTGTFYHQSKAVFHHLKLALYGEHSAKVAAAAYAVGDLLGMSHDQLKHGLASITPVRGRMNPLAGLNGSIIIDDTYNSSPEAALAALNTLLKTPVSGRRIALLGSMDELGDQSSDYHKKVGTAAAGVDLLITLGSLATQYLAPAAVAAGLDPTRSQTASSPRLAAEYLKLILKPGDVLLVKGSQNAVFAEEAVKLLLADPFEAGKLVRQSPAWMKIKRRQFSDID